LRKKAYLLSLVLVLAVFMMLVFAQFASATVVSGDETGPQTGASGSSTGSATGAPMLIISAFGSAMVGGGYLLRRKASK
jgi:hypothetical protein